MVFSSYIFVLAFLPCVLVGYYLLSRLHNPYPQRIFLVLSSLFFYGYFEPKYLTIILGSIAVNFAVASLSLRCKSKTAKRILLSVSVIFNVLLLGYYKYFDFFASSINALASTQITLRKILLPLGISFFTFQQLSFQIMVYRSEKHKLNFVNYSLFVSFFPQLVAGPIVRYDEFVPQLDKPDIRQFNIDNLALGLFTFTLGLFKKIIIADTVSVIVDNGFNANSSLGLLPAWVCALGYTFQIYFDFSGYSDMAIGLGKMFNIELPINFDSPYKSSSISDFWKRWHITLGKSLSEFVYIPLGGNRHGRARKCLNLFLTFLVSGIWHGAAWTFVAWGVAHGAARVFEEIFQSVLNKIPKLIRTAFTFLFVCMAFVLFRAESFSQAIKIYRGTLNLSSFGISQFRSIISDGIIGLPNGIAVVLTLSIILICFLLVFRSKSTAELTREFNPTPARAAVCAVLLIASIIGMSRSAVFIYFNF